MIQQAPCADGKLSDWSAWNCDGVSGTAIRTRFCINPINSNNLCPHLPMKEW